MSFCHYLHIKLNYSGYRLILFKPLWPLQTLLEEQFINSCLTAVFFSILILNVFLIKEGHSSHPTLWKQDFTAGYLVKHLFCDWQQWQPPCRHKSQRRPSLSFSRASSRSFNASACFEETKKQPSPSFWKPVQGSKHAISLVVFNVCRTLSRYDLFHLLW